MPPLVHSPPCQVAPLVQLPPWNPLATCLTTALRVCCLQVRQIERRWAMQEAAKYDGSRLLRTADAYESAVGFVDASSADNWRLLHLNAPAVELLGERTTVSGSALCLLLLMLLQAAADVAANVAPT